MSNLPISWSTRGILVNGWTIYIGGSPDRSWLGWGTRAFLDRHSHWSITWQPIFSRGYGRPKPFWKLSKS